MRNTRLPQFLAGFLLGAVLISGLDGQQLLPIAPVKPAGMPFIRSYRADTVPPLRVVRFIAPAWDDSGREPVSDGAGCHRHRH